MNIKTIFDIIMRLLTLSKTEYSLPIFIYDFIVKKMINTQIREINNANIFYNLKAINIQS